MDMKNVLVVARCEGWETVGEAENQINDLEYKETKNNQSEQQEKKSPQNEDSVSSLWDNVKRSNIASQGSQEEKTKSKKLEMYLQKQWKKTSFIWWRK